MKNKRALIIGITGQDGAYLSRLLLEKGYEVRGTVRRTSLINTHRIDSIYDDKNYKDRFSLVYGDLTDPLSLSEIITNFNPHEVYNLGAQSHVKVSFQIPHYTANVDALGTLNLLEIIRQKSNSSSIRFYQASTSELYGKVQEIPQNENTPFYPRSPYGVSKLYGYWIVKNYRESYDVHASNGILFNHESPLRGETFVTRKITIGLSKILKNKANTLQLGNLNSMRDWGHAKDYVEAMWKMLQKEKPDDYVIATGKQYSVREFIESSLKNFDIELDWVGTGLNERGIVSKSDKKFEFLVGKEIVKVDKKYFRPAEVDTLLGDPSKAKKELQWEPRISFDELVKEMICKDYDNI